MKARSSKQIEKDIESLKEQVFGDPSISDIIDQVNENMRKFRALMLHLNLEFEKCPKFRVVKKSGGDEK